MTAPTFAQHLAGKTMGGDHVNLGMEAIKGAPPAGVVAMHFMGFAIADWVQLLMLVYALGLCVQTIYRAITWWRARRVVIALPEQPIG